MNIPEILPPQHVACDVEAPSKKRALERLSELIAAGQDAVSAADVFDILLARERLGGTGIGHGVAIPHGRLKDGTLTLGAFVKLKSGIDFDAPDREPVDLLFALLVPEAATGDHLRTLAQLAAMFSDAAMRDKLRAATDAADLHRLVTDWLAAH
jgi:nitrogen PTS system EIIA component